MRRWRVGTISMGSTFILLGIVLLISMFKGVEIYTVLMKWWPAVLIVLGIEVLVYLFLAKEENPTIKYDVLSIFFVGILGVASIGFAVISSTGVMDEIQRVVKAEDIVDDLPELDSPVPENIKRIVLDPGHTSAVISTSNNRKLHVFGTYMHNSSLKDIKKKDYVSTKVAGDTLYVTLKELPRKNGPFSTNSYMEPTIVVPLNVDLTVRGGTQNIQLDPGMLQANWTIEDSPFVNLNIMQNSDVLVKAEVRYHHDSNQKANWDSFVPMQADTPQEKNPNGQNMAVEVGVEATGVPQLFKGTLKQGAGTHQINIFDGENIDIKKL